MLPPPQPGRTTAARRPHAVRIGLPPRPAVLPRRCASPPRLAAAPRRRSVSWPSRLQYSHIPQFRRRRAGRSRPAASEGRRIAGNYLFDPILISGNSPGRPHKPPQQIIEIGTDLAKIRTSELKWIYGGACL